VHYCTGRGYSEAEASSTIVISRDAEGRYVVSAGNAVEAADGEALLDRVGGLAAMDAAALKAAYKEQLRRPREDGASPGLGLLDMARKASAPLTAALAAIPDGRSYFTLRVVI
ncbi:MAG TPA: SiaB family protein kinase, partial [Deinococcales bacterium]|nr:SiaB family protein kinase [Deinococcales bacterium]